MRTPRHRRRTQRQPAAGRGHAPRSSAATYDDRSHPIAVTQELIVPDAPFESGLGPEVDLVIERHRARSEPARQVWSAEWDAAGHLAVEHLNLGEIVRWTYDASGRVVKRDYDDTKGGGSLITWTYRASGACRPMPQFLYTMQGGEWQVKPLVDDYCPETERRTSRDGATLMGEERREYNDAGDLLRIEEIHHDLDNLRTGQLFTYDVAGNLLTKFWLRDGSVVPHATYDYGCWPR